MPCPLAKLHPYASAPSMVGIDGWDTSDQMYGSTVYVLLSSYEALRRDHLAAMGQISLFVLIALPV